MAQTFIAHRRSSKFLKPRGYSRYQPYDFAEQFHYDGYDEIEVKDFFGPMWCIAEEETINDDGDFIITVRCWYKRTTPTPKSFCNRADVVIEVAVDHNEPGCFPYFWINKDVLKWNSALRNHVIAEKLTY